jgi:hypothetical protein
MHNAPAFVGYVFRTWYPINRNTCEGLPVTTALARIMRLHSTIVPLEHGSCHSAHILQISSTPSASDQCCFCAAPLCQARAPQLPLWPPSFVFLEAQRSSQPASLLPRDRALALTTHVTPQTAVNIHVAVLCCRNTPIQFILDT